MSERQPQKKAIREAIRLRHDADRLLREGEDLSQTNRLLAQAQAARPSLKKPGTIKNRGKLPRK